MELVDVPDSKSGVGNYVSVRPRPSANFNSSFGSFFNDFVVEGENRLFRFGANERRLESFCKMFKRTFSKTRNCRLTRVSKTPRPSANFNSSFWELFLMILWSKGRTDLMLVRRERAEAGEFLQNVQKNIQQNSELPFNASEQDTPTISKF